MLDKFKILVLRLLVEILRNAVFIRSRSMNYHDRNSERERSHMIKRKQNATVLIQEVEKYVYPPTNIKQLRNRPNNKVGGESIDH